MSRAMHMQWDALLTQGEVADLLRVHVTTLRRWAASGTGPRETRLGSVVRYAESDVQRWLEARKREHVA